MKRPVSFQIFRALIVAALVVGSSFSARSAELTDELIKSAKRIVVIPGTYDPINNGHIAMAKAALKTWNGDLAVLLPNSKPFHKIASPLVVRQRLIAKVLKDEPKIAVSRDRDENLSRQNEEGSMSFDSRLVDRIRELNPNAKIALAVGEDVAGQTITRLTLGFRTKPDEVLIASRPSAELVDGIARVWKTSKTSYITDIDFDTSSTEGRKILRENFQLYFETPERRSIDPAYRSLQRVLPKPAADEILESGLYLDRAVGGSVPTTYKLKLMMAQSLRRLAAAFNLYEDVKSEMVRRVARTEQLEIDIGDKTYRTIKHLGSGLSADAYLLDYEGTAVVAKIARDTEKSRHSLLRSIPIHLWAQKKLGMNVPNLVAYDLEGRWLLTEFIQGPTLAKFIEQNRGLRGEVRASVIDLHGKVGTMLDRSSVNLDLAPDNVIVKDGKAYLVDLGPILATDLYFPPVKELLGVWEAKYSGSGNPVPRIGIRTCEMVFN